MLKSRHRRKHQQLRLLGYRWPIEELCEQRGRDQGVNVPTELGHPYCIVGLIRHAGWIPLMLKVAVHLLCQ